MSGASGPTPSGPRCRAWTLASSFCTSMSIRGAASSRSAPRTLPSGSRARTRHRRPPPGPARFLRQLTDTAALRPIRHWARVAPLSRRMTCSLARLECAGNRPAAARALGGFLFPPLMAIRRRRSAANLGDYEDGGRFSGRADRVIPTPRDRHRTAQGARSRGVKPSDHGFAWNLWSSERKAAVERLFNLRLKSVTAIDGAEARTPMPMFAELISPERLVFSGEVESVLLPGGGRHDHPPRAAPLVTMLNPGVAGTGHGGQSSRAFVRGGMVEVTGSTVTILAERGGWRLRK